MKKLLVTGAGGLIGSACVEHFIKNGYEVHGIDNNSRERFFGEQGSVAPTIEALKKIHGYLHYSNDITRREEVLQVIRYTKPDAIIHCAAQPSHDLAAKIPFDDFDTNANGTLNILEALRVTSTHVPFVHVSTNKVYGDNPNKVPIIELERRYEYASKYYGVGINETMSIDDTLHSLFGASKLSGDIVAQEYGRYFGMPIGVFRGGCLTGPQHASVELHGFLSYIVKCIMNDKPYTVYGYKGKQVRDQIHAYDVATAFEAFIDNPTNGEAYNIGGGYENSVSIVEVMNYLNKEYGKKSYVTYIDRPRTGDHIVYYSDMSKFTTKYSNWKRSYTAKDIIDEIVEKERKN